MLAMLLVRPCPAKGVPPLRDPRTMASGKDKHSAPLSRAQNRRRPGMCCWFEVQLVNLLIGSGLARASTTPQKSSQFATRDAKEMETRAARACRSATAQSKVGRGGMRPLANHCWKTGRERQDLREMECCRRNWALVSSILPGPLAGKGLIRKGVVAVVMQNWGACPTPQSGLANSRFLCWPASNVSTGPLGCSQ